jgi:subtilisin-like proprotein convertase family protein
LLCRFPDMYDYGKRDGDLRGSAGIGFYCLMGAGNHLDSGRSPAPVCSYLRDLAGWCDTVVDINVPGRYEAKQGDYGTVLKFRSSKPNEYFLVENRLRKGLDRAGTSNGLAIYHCDTLGSNELQQGSPTQHYQCALLQADGRRDLEDNHDQGDATDLFSPTAGVVVSSTSRPNSREWDGRASGLVVSDISIANDKISFSVGQSLAAQIIRGESSPELAIPDDQAQGVSNTISISASGIIRRIKVSVNITHTYIGDLLVELFSPTGRRAVLHSRSGGTKDDLIVSYDSNSPGELTALVGQPMQGNWVLNVSDREGQDLGILHKWVLDFESSSV